MRKRPVMLGNENGACYEKTKSLPPLKRITKRRKLAVAAVMKRVVPLVRAAS